jgi:hypothetical protein
MSFLSDPPLTKRQLGGLIGLAGLGGLLAVLASDRLGAGQWQGLGPAQWQALGVAVGVTVLGLTLLPLGDRPA